MVCASLWILKILLETRIKTKEIRRELEINQSQWLKAYIELNIKARIEAEEIETKMEKQCAN